MTALEEIEAAIENLTKLRDAATKGPWLVGPGESTPDYIVTDSGSWIIGDAFEPNDVPLIVTLHRALPEIIQLLSSVAFRLVAGSTGPLELDHTLLLARSITGGTE